MENEFFYSSVAYRMVDAQLPRFDSPAGVLSAVIKPVVHRMGSNLMMTSDRYLLNARRHVVLRFF